MTKTLATGDLIAAAARALIAERCRRSYLHDLRGDLQSLNSSLELLARAARSEPPNPALCEKAGGIARKALLAHEKALTDVLLSMAPGDETEADVDLGALAAEAKRLLRGDALRGSVAFDATPLCAAVITSAPHACRAFMTGISALLIDALQPGASLTLRTERLGASAVIAWRCDAALPAVRLPSSLDARTPFSPYELVLAAASQWASAAGGRLELPASPGEDTVRILHPSGGRVA